MPGLEEHSQHSDQEHDFFSLDQITDEVSKVCGNCLNRGQWDRCEATGLRSGTVCSDNDPACDENFDPR